MNTQRLHTIMLFSIIILLVANLGLVAYPYYKVRQMKNAFEEVAADWKKTPTRPTRQQPPEPREEQAAFILPETVKALQVDASTQTSKPTAEPQAPPPISDQRAFEIKRADDKQEKLRRTELQRDEVCVGCNHDPFGFGRTGERVYINEAAKTFHVGGCVYVGPNMARGGSSDLAKMQGYTPHDCR